MGFLRLDTPHHLTEYDWVRFDRPFSVETRQLDDWCSEAKLDAVDFIWMDVQGAEADIIAGGMQTVSNTRFLALPLQEAIDLISATASFDVSAASTLVIHNLLALPCIEAAPHIPEQRHVMWGATRGDLCALGYENN
ncbi:FkbM family methyltransferase [Bradyrhizobium sp. ma5]|uniref:FkbM family methyltransferase n=1 Tax=Bradyrhizobium sp. ma5 TaxID=3344828 RepID=UPI0035D4BCD2